MNHALSLSVTVHSLTLMCCFECLLATNAVVSYSQLKFLSPSVFPRGSCWVLHVSIKDRHILHWVSTHSFQCNNSLQIIMVTVCSWLWVSQTSLWSFECYWFRFLPSQVILFRKQCHTIIEAISLFVLYRPDQITFPEPDFNASFSSISDFQAFNFTSSSPVSLSSQPLELLSCTQ